MECYVTENDGIYYIVNRDDEESNDEFYYRCNCIAKSKPTNEQQYIKAITKSKIQRNQQFLNLKYK